MFVKGDYVLYYSGSITNTLKSKDKHWEGPYEVLGVFGNNVMIWWLNSLGVSFTMNSSCVK